MTDYTRTTGSGPGATMMIRDTGITVEFWLNSNNGTTWTDHLPWSYNAGSSGSASGSFYYHPGSGWQKVAAVNVWSSNNVSFSIGATGTQGFGGPTTLGPVWINRSTVPPAPNPVQFNSITSTSVHAWFSGNGDGGSGIYEWQIGWGTDPNNVQNIIHTFDSVVSGLTPGTTYYFWARGTNANGAGAWSARSQVTTLRVPDAPSTPVLTQIGPTSMVVSWTPNGDGGSPITGFDIGYAFEGPSGPTSAVMGVSSPYTLNNLQPGTTYWVWVRADNAVGAGPYSATPASAMTIAGARIKVGADWKVAVPYVRVGGVWKLATPWVKDAGEWKETI